MAGIDFKAVLACVARAAHDDGLAVALQFLVGVEREVAAIDAEHALELFLGLGALQSQLAVEVALVCDAHVVVLLLLVEPGHILVDVGSVIDQEEVVVAHLVDQQVVDSAAVGIQHHAVIHLALGGIPHIVGEHVVHIFLCIGAGDSRLAHV